MKNRLSALIVLAVAIMITISVSVDIKTVYAQDTSYTISNVKHTVSVLQNGYVLINDTLALNASEMPREIFVGFPYKYGSHVIRGVAYSGSETFNITLNVPVENRMGFYYAKVAFPNSAPQTFSTVFLLSNDLLTQDSTNKTRFTLDFPIFPSLTETAKICNASVSLPTSAAFLASSFNSTGFTYSEKNLSAFNYSPGNVTFLMRDTKIQKFAIEQVNKQVTVDQFGNIGVADTYKIISKTTSPWNLSSVEVRIPLNATGISAQDYFGRALRTPNMTDQNTNTYNITFVEPVATNFSLTFTVRYELPVGIYSPVQSGISSYDLNLTVFQNIDGYAETASATFILPEGAKITSLKNVYGLDNYAVSKNVFQESIVIKKYNVLSLDDVAFDVSYDYNPLWASFRPSLWMWSLALVGFAVGLLVWRRPKAPTPIVKPTMATQASPALIRSFVESYEEKLKMLREIDLLETRAEEGKIPRQRYKVQRKTLETRLETLSKNLADYNEQMKSSGGQYPELILRLEVAESEIKEVSANTKAAETMHNRGELSLEAYRKRLADYQHRRKNAETTTNGILLRLREEIH